MGAVDGIAAVHVGADGVPGLASCGCSKVEEGGVLVGRGVSAQDAGGIEVVGIGAGAARVVGREAEDIEVGMGGDNRVCSDVVLESRVRAEGGLDEFAGDADGVVGDVVEVAANDVEDVRGEVGSIIEDMAAPTDLGAVQLASSDDVPFLSCVLDPSCKALLLSFFWVFVFAASSSLARIDFLID